MASRHKLSYLEQGTETLHVTAVKFAVFPSGMSIKFIHDFVAKEKVPCLLFQLKRNTVSVAILVECL